MARRIKHTGGQKRTLPIKDKRMLDRVMTYLLIERDHAIKVIEITCYSL